MTALDPRMLRRAFGSFMTGVTVVTTRDRDGTPVGFTANSFSSVSLDPPLLSVCPGRFLSSFEVLRDCAEFGVSILAEGQEDASNTFASFKGDRFSAVPWTPGGNGAPLIDGAAAWFCCRTANVVDAGDHAILIGEVTGAETSGRRGLGYAEGGYFSLGLERAAAAPRRGGTVAGAVVEHGEAVLLAGDASALRPPEIELTDAREARAALAGFLADAGLTVTIGPAYAIYDDRATGRRHIYFKAEAENGVTGGIGAFHPVTELPAMRFATSAHAAMMTRFAEEHETRSFGLYIGDDAAGEIDPHSHRI